MDLGKETIKTEGRKTLLDAFQLFRINDNDNDKPIKSLLKGKGLLTPVGLARLDS
jgi:hypothetical protein